MADSTNIGLAFKDIAAIAAHEMSRLWQAHGIIELVVESIGDEPAGHGPSIKPALQASADLILASINALEPICTKGALEAAYD